MSNFFNFFGMHWISARRTVFVFDDLKTGLVDHNVRLNRIHERAQSVSYGINQIRTLYRFQTRSASFRQTIDIQFVERVYIME